METETENLTLSGTIFAGDRPRLVEVGGIQMEAELGPYVLFVTNTDKPGYIGALGTTLGDAGINIATFHLGRTAPGGDAIALVEVDAELPEAVVESVRALPHVVRAWTLSF